MSVEAMTLALNHSRSEGTAKLILIGIANHDGDGGSWPSVATLAKYANVTERTVQRHINTLIELGEIERVMNDGGTHRTAPHMRPNLYKILLRCPANCDGSTQHRMSEPSQDPVTPVSPGDASVTPPPDTSVTPPVTPVSPEPSLNLPLNLPEKDSSVLTSPETTGLHLPDWCPREKAWLDYASNLCASRELDFETALWNYTNSGYFGGETPNAQRFTANWVLIEVDCRAKGKPLPGHETLAVDTPESMEAAFELFWDAYPKKEQRKIAEAAFKWAVTQADAALIIKQAKGFKRKCDEEKTEHNFIPAPHNWLKASRWTDVYPSGFKPINHTGDV